MENTRSGLLGKLGRVFLRLTGLSPLSFDFLRKDLRNHHLDNDSPMCYDKKNFFCEEVRQCTIFYF